MRSGHHGTTLGRPGDCDPASASELEQPFVAQRPQCAEHRVRVHAENGREVFRRREALARLGLAVCDRAADLSSDRS